MHTQYVEWPLQTNTLFSSPLRVCKVFRATISELASGSFQELRLQHPAASVMFGKWMKMVTPGNRTDLGWEDSPVADSSFSCDCLHFKQRVHRCNPEERVLANGGFHKLGVPKNWMVYIGQSHWNGWFEGTMGYPYFRKPPNVPECPDVFSIPKPFPILVRTVQSPSSAGHAFAAKSLTEQLPLCFMYIYDHVWALQYTLLSHLSDFCQAI